MADSDCLAGRSFQLPVVHESLELFRVSEILAGISSALDSDSFGDRGEAKARALGEASRQKRMEKHWILTLVGVWVGEATVRPFTANTSALHRN